MENIEKKETKKDSDMDSKNKEASEILLKEGSKKFVEHVFTDKETGAKLSYAEMRMMYG
jgi:hypothetical protein